MPMRMALREVRLLDYNGNEADLSGSGATLALDDEPDMRWWITADTDQPAYFHPVASFYNVKMVTEDGRTFKGEVSLTSLTQGSGKTAAIVLTGSGELLGYTSTPHAQ